MSWQMSGQTNAMATVIVMESDAPRKKPRHGGAGAKSIAANTGSDALIKHLNPIVHMQYLWESNYFFEYRPQKVKFIYGQPVISTSCALQPHRQ
jgi:hypothetical protein